MTEPPPPAPPSQRPFGRAGARAARKGRRLRAATGAAAAVAGVLVLGFGLAIWMAYLRGMPALPAEGALYADGRAPAIRFLDRDGQLIAERGPRYAERVRLADLPEQTPLAFLAAQDKRFYQHGPVQPLAMLRRFSNEGADENAQNDTTLSQQVAAGLFPTPDRGLKRTLQTAVMAARLEGRLGKDGVLELYLNRVYLGADAYGVDGAARLYFGKPARRLTLAEAALLASLPTGTSTRASTRDLASARARSRRVLAEMRRNGWISAADETAALAHPPQISPDPRPDTTDFGHALDYATNEVVRLVGADAPNVQVRLTLDRRMQRSGALIVRRVLAGEGRAAGATQAALVALGPDGGVRAMVGGADEDATPLNAAADVRRPPGSAFRPFIYAATLETGAPPDEAGAMDAAGADLARETGPQAVAELARRFGFSGLPARPDAAIGQGVYPVSVLEMAGGVQVFQAGGGRVAPWIVEDVRTLDGKALYVRPPTTAAPAYDAAQAQRITAVMENALAKGDARRAGFGRPAAGGGGVSQGRRDAWFAGFTPDLAAAVWVGDEEARPLDKPAGEAAAQIWRRFMIGAHQDLPVRDFDWKAAAAPRRAPGSRAAFYADLADAFAAAQTELSAPQSAPEPAAGAPSF